jgi:16S rRNA (cytidine1402-2'-O)-methyltransferase
MNEETTAVGKKKGKLYLLPSPLGPDALHTLPAAAIAVLHSLTYLVAERARTARHFIKETRPPKPIGEYQIAELNEHTPETELPGLLQPALQGHDLGMLSEAGCPGIADPGAALARIAHRHGVEVVPLTGPSSILLALMASGLNGQQFCFHGYLSPRPADLAKDLKRLEQAAARQQQTQLFIETPYRNKALFEQALASLQPGTLFCVAADLTLPTQYIKTLSIGDWRKSPQPDLHKRPAIFLIGV